MSEKTETPLQEVLMNTVRRSPEHDVLTRLVGEWDFTGEWYLIPGKPVVAQGRMVNRGILGGHFVESRSYFDDVEKSRVIYGFDPEEARFMAFAISAIAARCDLEHGQYDNATDTLRFNCIEYVGAERLAVRFERTVSLLTSDNLRMRITYPDFEPERQLGMELRMQRAMPE
jgi:hypothetical protein